MWHKTTLLQFLLIILVNVIVCETNETCWQTKNSNNSSSECVIAKYEQHFVTLNKCFEEANQTTWGLANLSNCQHILKLSLQYCEVQQPIDLNCNENATTHIEFLQLQHNVINELSGTFLSKLQNSLKELYLYNNSVQEITIDAFNNLTQLEIVDIYKETNLSLNFTEIFKETNLTILHINEIKQMNATLLQNLPKNLQTFSLKNTNILAHNSSAILLNLQTLKNITVNFCQLKHLKLIASIQNESRVENLNFSYNNLQTFEIGGGIASVKCLDLSHNQLTYLPLNWLSQMSNLKRIFMHDNLLQTFSLGQLLYAVKQLEYIDLRQNFITSLLKDDDDDKYENVYEYEGPTNNLYINKHNNTNHNQVKNNENIKKLPILLNINYDYLDVRLQVDYNAWNCKWLLHFAHMEPQKFRLFAYDKYISPLNINGLACNMDNLTTLAANYYATAAAAAAAASSTTLATTTSITAGKPTTTAATTTITTTTATTNTATGSDEAGTVITANLSNINLIDYGVWEKRSQRAEALFIVFMLPLGIAVLFGLLYIWIYCQKIFHMSTYRSCRWSNCHSGRRVPADVVRHMPATQTVLNDGYEIPMSSSTMPLCACNNPNCTNCRKNSPDSSQLQTQFNQGLNMNYDKFPTAPIPTPAPYTLYEEILHDDMLLVPKNTKTTTTTTTAAAAAATPPTVSTTRGANIIQHPVYDHLSFDLQATDI